MTTEIKFGTDGWRSVIADGFTFHNVKRVTQAACDVVRKSTKSRLILVGYDRRFFSEQFAETSARVAAANGFRVEMASAPISSPALSFQVRHKKAAMGFMITASHNPPMFNGFKLKSPVGGSADPAFTKSVEDRVDVSEIQDEKTAIHRSDFSSNYIQALKSRFRPSSSSLPKAPVVFDAMHGPGGDLFEKLIGSSGKVRFIRQEPDPLFGGINPEPIEANLDALKKAVLETKAAIGIAVDGDADRIGVIDDQGKYLPPHTVMPLLLLHLIEDKKMKGKVVQTVSMGNLTRRIAEHFKLPFEEVPVGFKHIAQKMIQEKVFFGGEESGGYGLGSWNPERDGLLCALLLLDMLAIRKARLSDLVADLHQRFGASVFRRVDFPMKEALDKSAWTEFIKSTIGPEFSGQPVKQLSTLDGIKITLQDDSWVLMRPSGTEPLLRTYAESASSQSVDTLLDTAKILANTPLPGTKKAAGGDSKKSKLKKKLKLDKKLKKKN